MIDAGIYRDDIRDEIHLCIDEILEAHGYELTKGNRATVEEAFREVAAAFWPGVPIEIAGDDNAKR